MNKKELKSKAKKIVKEHYGILVIIFFIVSFLGLENASSVSTMFTALSGKGFREKLNVEYISKTVLDRRFSGYGDIIRYIEKGFSDDSVSESTKRLKENLAESLNEGRKNIQDNLYETMNEPIKDVPENMSETFKDGKDSILNGINDFKDDVKNLTDSVKESASDINDTPAEIEDIGPVTVGTTAGVFAGIFNAFTSGKYFNSLFTGIVSIFRSESVAAVILLILLALFSLFIWFFVVRVFPIIVRRMLLEARIYRKVPLSRITFLLRVRSWMHCAWVLFVTILTIIVRFLTIVGGITAYYKFILVPYILAENPSLSARDAMKLSRLMMEGHKRECFGLQCSFIGWKLLGVITFGLTDVFFTNAYIGAAFTEYYVQLRQLAQKNKLELSEKLNDVYLYEYAENDIIADAYQDIVKIADNPMEEPERLSGISGFFARNFGIVLFAGKREKQHCEYDEEQIKIERKLAVFENEIYPMRLFPGYKMSRLKTLGKFAPRDYLHYTRRYSLWSIIMLFFIFSFIGWMWEVFLHFYEDGVFVNRGVLHGPYLPIYGTGGLLILVLLYRLRKKPFLEMLSMFLLCGTVEFFTAYLLDFLYGKEWWNYDGYFLNINGWVCAEGLLVFVIGGMSIVYLVAPALDTLLSRLRLRVVVPVCIALLLIFLTDVIFCSVNPNSGAGITDYETVEGLGTDYGYGVGLENNQ